MNNFLIEKGAEIFKVKKNEKMIDCFNEEIKNINSHNITTYIVRIKLNNKFVSIQTENLDNPEKIYEELLENSKIIQNEETSDFARENIDEIKRNNNSLSNEKVIEFLKEISKKARTYDYMKSFRVVYTYVSENFEINNKNVCLKDATDYNVLSLELTMGKEEILMSSFEDLYFNELDKEIIENKIFNIIENTNFRLNEKNSNTDSNKVIIKNSVVAKILNELVDGFHGENIKNSLSPFSNKINEKIFSDLITIVEDSENSIGARLFDNEGTKKIKQTIIEDGKFVKMIHNNKTAKFFNELPTGNKGVCRNLLMKPGNENIYLDFKDGYIIEDVQGTHSGINTITGQISLQARGTIVKDNEKIPVENLIMTTTIFDLLTNVVKVGNDLEIFSLELTTPSILVENISIVSDN